MNQETEIWFEVVWVQYLTILLHYAEDLFDILSDLVELYALKRFQFVLADIVVYHRNKLIVP